MKQLNVSTKITSPIMVWVSVLLIAATLLFSFAPIMCFDTTTDTGNEVINEFIDGISKTVDIDIPDKIEITVGKLISSVRVLAKVVKVASSAVKSVTSEDASSADVDKAAEELDALLETKAGQDTILVAAAIVCTFTNSVDFSGDTHFLAIITNVLFVLGSLMFVLVSMFVITIKLIFMFIKSLILALQNIKTPENAASTISGKLPELLSFPFVMMLLQTIIPGMTYGSGVVAMCYIIGFSVLFATVISRLSTYEAKKFMYLNVLQGTTIVSIVGFFVFFFNIVKTNVINNFLSGNFSIQLANLLTGKLAAEAAKRPFEPNSAYIVDFVLIFVFMIVLLSSAGYITHAANKLSCTVDPKKQRSKLADCKLVAAIVLLITYIAPTLVAGKTNFFKNVESKEAIGDESFLILSEVETAALKSALVGIIIMIVAEVALIVLKKVLCKDLTALEASAIVCGVDEEKTVAAPAEAPVAEEAPAAEEVPAAEEAPAEAPAAEEAPVETPAE